MQRSLAVIAAVAAAVVVLIAVAAMPTPDTDDGDHDMESAPSRIIVEGLPDGFVVDEVTNTIASPAVTEWHVHDDYHTAYNTDRFGGFTTPYEGDDIVADSVTFEPGGYTVTASGVTFSVTVYGTVERSVSWTYSMEGREVRASVTYTLDMRDVMDSIDGSRVWNAKMNGNGSAAFSHLPDIVVCGDTTDRLESQLRQEYLRIGGDPDDGQGYLDFIASFVQLNVRYPGTVEDRRSQWDYGVYGAAEYWALPQETLYHLYGDCEDTSALLCALYIEAGYDVAMGGKSGHVFAGVALDGYRQHSDEFIKGLGIGHMQVTHHSAVGDDGGREYYAVETIYDQIPVGYVNWVDFGAETLYWGTTGFYPVSG